MAFYRPRHLAVTMSLAMALSLLLSSSAQGQNFIRGDANNDGVIDIGDAVRILEHIEFGAPIPPPLDRADVNDNEFITLTDGFMLIARLFCPPFPTIPAPHPNPGPDPSNATGAFGFVQPGYSIDFEVATATATSITYSVLVTSPLPVIGVEFSIMMNSPLLTNAPTFTPAPGQNPTTTFEDHDGVHYGLRVGYDNCLDVLAPAGAGGEIGTLTFDLGAASPPCVAPLLNWVADTIIGGNHYRGSIITADFVDHHPSSTTETCGGFIRGDANGDGEVLIADTVYMIAHYINQPSAPAPVGCLGTEFRESADVNDNEWFTIADIMMLNAVLFQPGTPPITPPNQCGFDPDDNQQGFDVPDPGVALNAVGQVLAGEYRMNVFVRPTTFSDIRGVTFIAEFDSTLALPPNPRDVFCPSGFLDGFFLAVSGNHVIVTVVNDAFASFPTPDTNGRFFLGTLQFEKIADFTCPANPVGFRSQLDYGPNGVTYRATVVDGNYVDHHPVLGTPSCFDVTGARFIRGDCNGDGTVDIGDPICNLGYQFTGGDGLCLDALDTNDDGSVTLGDPITNLAYLFQNGPPPPAPFPGCGTDLTMDCLRCAQYPNPTSSFQCAISTTP